MDSLKVEWQAVCQPRSYSTGSRGGVMKISGWGAGDRIKLKFAFDFSSPRSTEEPEEPG